MKTFPLLIIVPARGDSKRLPGKNIKLLAGKSLLAYTAESITQAALDAPVILSTDDDDIAAEGERLNWLVPFRRPAELAHDTAPTIDAVIHALDWFRDQNGSDPEAVMVLQATSPLRGNSCLIEAVEALKSREDVDSVISMTPVHVSPRQLYFTDAKGIGIPVSEDNRQPVYAPNGALYLTRCDKLREENSLYAGNILLLKISSEQAIDIDTQADFRFAEATLAAGLAAKGNDQNSSFATEPDSE